MNDAFAAYLAMRERSAPVPGSKIVNLIEQLNTFKDKGCSDDDLVEIVKEATSKGWMNFYKSDKKKQTLLNEIIAKMIWNHLNVNY